MGTLINKTMDGLKDDPKSSRSFWRQSYIRFHKKKIRKCVNTVIPYIIVQTCTLCSTLDTESRIAISKLRIVHYSFNRGLLVSSPSEACQKCPPRSQFYPNHTRRTFSWAFLELFHGKSQSLLYPRLKELQKTSSCIPIPAPHK